MFTCKPITHLITPNSAKIRTQQEFIEETERIKEISPEIDGSRELVRTRLDLKPEEERRERLGEDRVRVSKCSDTGLF